MRHKGENLAQLWAKLDKRERELIGPQADQCREVKQVVSVLLSALLTEQR